MGKVPPIEFPFDVDWRCWIERWDRMQDRYLLRRRERFELMVRLIADTQGSVLRVLDLGCGTGSLMLRVLEEFLDARVCGIDYDPTLLVLGAKRLTEFGERARLIEGDLRDESWLDAVPEPTRGWASSTLKRPLPAAVPWQCNSGICVGTWCCWCTRVKWSSAREAASAP